MKKIEDKKLRFRAYLKQEKIMVEVKSIHLGTQKIIYGYSENSQGYGNKSCEFNNIELMKYTGLEDKNDKEIYEGDIVIAHYFFQNYDPTTLGAFEDEDEITGKIVCDLDGFRVIDRTDECRQLPLSMIQEPVEELEVIGNIYENKDLIGE